MDSPPISTADRLNHHTNNSGYILEQSTFSRNCFLARFYFIEALPLPCNTSPQRSRGSLEVSKCSTCVTSSKKGWLGLSFLN